VAHQVELLHGGLRILEREHHSHFESLTGQIEAIKENGHEMRSQLEALTSRIEAMKNGVH
jgi:hypothetical protein